MGDGDELSLDYDKLNKVYQDLDEQKNLVQSLKLGHAPAVSAFGGSAKGEWLANAVIKGHKNINDAKEDTVRGLEKYASAVDLAIKDIAKTDEGAALVAKRMADALEVMSKPLMIFAGKIPLPF